MRRMRMRKREKKTNNNNNKKKKKKKKKMMMMMMMNNYGMSDRKRYFTRIVGPKRWNISTGTRTHVPSGQSRSNRKA